MPPMPLDLTVYLLINQWNPSTITELTEFQIWPQIENMRNYSTHYIVKPDADVIKYNKHIFLKTQTKCQPSDWSLSGNSPSSTRSNILAMLPPPLLGADELTKCPKNLSRISCSDLADTAILAQKASKTRKQIQTNPLFSSLTHTLPIADKKKKKWIWNWFLSS